MYRALLIPALLALLTGCGQSQPFMATTARAVGTLVARADTGALAAFLKEDPTFTGTGVQNAYKVASASDGKTFVVQMWYRDLQGYFGDADTVQAEFGSGSGHDHFQSFTLTKLRRGFYQMDFSRPAHDVDYPVVAFHAGSQWDSNLGRNYAIHYQPFPHTPW